jgi:signal transduction histidine kinase
MMTHAKPVEPSASMVVGPAAPGTTAGAEVDVSPEAIAALVAEGASVLGHESIATEALPDALPLLVGITHDLRSPLSSMLVLIERLRAGHAGPVTPLQEKQLGLLYSATFGVASLVNDVLDVARGTAREALAPAPVQFSVADVWKSVRVLVQPIAEEKRLLLRWSGPQQDARVGHPAVLHRVLLNLVTNALKFTDSGSVTVSASDVGNDRVLFQVRDTGHGMPATVKAQFNAAPPSRKGALPSSGGLGIALCQQMLAPLNSALEFVEQRDAPGTCLAFTVELTAAG